MTVTWHHTRTGLMCSSSAPSVGRNLLLSASCLQIRYNCRSEIFVMLTSLGQYIEPTNFNSSMIAVVNSIPALMFCWNQFVLLISENFPTLSVPVNASWNIGKVWVFSTLNDLQMGHISTIPDSIVFVIVCIVQGPELAHLYQEWKILCTRKLS